MGPEITIFYFNFGSCFPLPFLEASPWGQVSPWYTVNFRTGFHHKPNPVGPFRKSPLCGVGASGWGWSLWVGRAGGSWSLNSLTSEFQGSTTSTTRWKTASTSSAGPSIFASSSGVSLKAPASSLTYAAPSRTSHQHGEAMHCLGHHLSPPERGAAAVLCHLGESTASASSKRPENRKPWIN